MNNTLEKCTPEGLAAEIGKSIKGQEAYLQSLGLCLWLHHVRKELYRCGETMSAPKSNLLVIGKSGTGKTASIRAMAEILDMPVVIEDASQLTSSGWKGRNVSEIAGQLNAVDGDEIDKQFAVVVLDEIDKLYCNGNHLKENSPVSNLLKLIEGMTLTQEDKDKKDSIETENILFICLGAFDGLEDIIKKRLHLDGKRTIGFSGAAEAKTPEADTADILHKATKEDLIDYGVSPQLLGRISQITATNELTTGMLKSIILDSDISVVKQYDRMLSKYLGVTVSITDGAAEHIAMEAAQEKTGARALSEKIVDAYKGGLYEIESRGDVSELLLDVEGDRLTTRYIKGCRKPTVTGADRERELYRQVPLGLQSPTARDAARKADAIIAGAGESIRRYPYSKLRAVSYLYMHAITVLLWEGRKEPTIADMAQVLKDLMEEVITKDFHGKTRSLDLSMEYEEDICGTLLAGEEILQGYCRQYRQGISGGDAL